MENKKKYKVLRIIGIGAFGTAYEGYCVDTLESVCIKKIPHELQSKELEIISSQSHRNIISYKDYFFSRSGKQFYLNIVTEYLPVPLSKMIHHYSSQGFSFPSNLVKIYSFQLLLAVKYLHNKNIAHRDIKPDNILIDPKTHILKLADFGLAKDISQKNSRSYVCSRFYRAPELIFGSTHYSQSVDMWSFGCVLAEMMLGQALFPGESSVDQLVEIIRVLGTPTREELKEMNPDFIEFRFPEIRNCPFGKIFHGQAERNVLNLMTKLLMYSPSLRMTATEAIRHPYYENVRDRSIVLPNGEALPDFDDSSIFNF